MKKIGIFMAFVAIFIIAILVGIYMYNSTNKTNNDKKIENNLSTNKIVANQIDYSIKNDITIKTNTSEEKISPKATFTLKRKYKECGHTLKEYKQIPEDLVNLTKEEIEERYSEWEIESFTKNSCVLLKEEMGLCGEHYVLRLKDNTIAIYKLEEDGAEVLEELTGISVEYLTQNDKLKIENGINVYGKEELNSMLEDFE